MRKDRMLNLADFLEKIPSKAFDMFSWVKPDWSSQKEIFCEKDILEGCGTAACVAGWTVLSSGKCFKEQSTQVFYRNGRPFLAYNNEVYAQSYAADYLGLDLEQAHKLFYVSGWPWEFKKPHGLSPTNKQAANRIRYMVERGI